MGLSSDGRIVAVGVPFRNQVHVLEYNGTGYELKRNIQLPGQTWHYIGSCLDISQDGKVLVVGSSTGTDVTVLIQNSSGSWSDTPVSALLPKSVLKSGYGQSVSISEDGSTIAVDARGTHQDHGGVFIYSRQGNTYEETFLIEPPEGSLVDISFGAEAKLSPDGSYLAVSSETAGVFVYSKGGGGWVLEFTLPTIGEVNHPPSLALSRRAGEVVVGVPTWNASRGRVHLFN